MRGLSKEQIDAMVADSDYVADQLCNGRMPYLLAANVACHVKALACEVEKLPTVEAALLRSRQGWVNAIELGIIHERYEEGARSIIAELTCALVLIGSDKAI